MALRDFKPWQVYLGIGLVLIPFFYAFSSGGDGQYAIFVVINGVAPLGVLSGPAATGRRGACRGSCSRRGRLLVVGDVLAVV